MKFYSFVVPVVTIVFTVVHYVELLMKLESRPQRGNSSSIRRTINVMWWPSD